MRAIVQHPRRWALAIAISTAVMGAPGSPVAAQGLDVQADASVNVGYNQTTRTVDQIDPSKDPLNPPPDDSTSSLFTEVRPGISLQFGSPRLTWRAAYVFSGIFSVVGGQGLGFSNQANLSLAAQLTQSSIMTVTGSASQGGTAFLQSQQAADSNQPMIRAPGNPDMISATLGESLSWQLGRQFTLQNSFTGSLTAPQNDLGDRNTVVSGTLGLERLFNRDVVGLDVRSSVSRLKPLEANQPAYTSITNALLGRWNHDFTWQWNALMTGGVEQVYTGTGSRPVALLPAGSVSVRYTVGNVLGALDYSRGTETNLQVGTVSLTDRITARGVITLNMEKARVLAFSAGFLHNEPLGEASVLVAAGTGNALQGDAGFSTAITRGNSILANVRYSVAYQYGQGAGVGPTLAHIFTIGVTARYTTSGRPIRPVPKRGERVDGSDGQGFPVDDDTSTPTTTTPTP